MDVLRALKTDESRLFPAPCLIEVCNGIVPREQEAELIDRIIGADRVPVIILCWFSVKWRTGVPC